MEAVEVKAETEVTQPLQQQLVNATGSRAQLYKSVFISNLGGAAIGFVVGWSSPTLTLLQAKDSEFPITKQQGALITSFLPFGMFVGPILGRWLMDNAGRRFTILTYMLLMLLSWGLIASLLSVWLLYLARFLQGVTWGLIMSTSTVYISEIAEVSIRGVLNTTLTICINTSILLAFAVGPYLSIHHYVYMACCPLLLFLILYPSLPESPYFLLVRGRDQKATKVLAYLRQLPQRDVANEVQLVKLAISSSKTGSYRELLARGRNLLALTTACLLMFCQQLSGSSCMFYYAQQVLQISGASIPSHMGALVMAVFIFLGSLGMPLVVKLWGIKRLLVTSVAGSALSLGLLGYFIRRCQTPDVNSFDSWMVIIMLAVYSFIAYSGITPLPWVMVGELFPSHLRPRGSAIVTLTHSLLAFSMLNLFPLLVTGIGLVRTCWLFSGITLLSAIYISLFVPDTTSNKYTQSIN